MTTQPLRRLMTEEIKDCGWLDYCFQRGDDNAKTSQSYKDWLESLPDDEFLDAYNRVRATGKDLD